MTNLQAIQLAMTDAVRRHGKKDSTGFGTCYATALEALCYFTQARKPVANQQGAATLVHAICHLQGSPLPVSHAYIEVDGHVVDLDGTYSAEEWRLQAQPTNIHRYTRRQAMEQAMKSGHYGPWSDDLSDHDEDALRALRA